MEDFLCKKKLLCAVLTVAMVSSMLAGCGSTNKTESTDTSKSTEAEAEGSSNSGR